jgi:hypothetical protein
MRIKKPRIARLDQVTISRNAEDAVIQFHDAGIATTHLRVGPEVHQMTDADILLMFNQTIAIEIPAGRPQVKHHPAASNQWSPRGGVLRCFIDDSEDGLEPVVHVDNQELSWEEFGRMLCCYAGWGMRIVFVPDDELDQSPKIVIRDTDD